MPTSLATRETDRAERTAATLELLADRLPDAEAAGSTTFGALWKDVGHLPGILGRNDFHALLLALDGARLEDSGLIVRVGRDERPSRRIVLVRPPRSWAEQRTHLRRYMARGRVHPPQPISYAAAHRRIRDERGRAADFICGECGERAAEWAYMGFSPDEQLGMAGDPETLRIWSPNPADYAPLCRECHWAFDELGIVWEGSSPASPLRRPAAPSTPLPAGAPAWVRALSAPPVIRDTERLAMLLDLQRAQLAAGDRVGALLTHRERMGLIR